MKRLLFINPFLVFCLLVLIIQANCYTQNLNFQGSGFTSAKNLVTANPQALAFAADTCVVLKASNNKVKHASVWNITPNSSSNNDPDFIATAWTWGGSYSVVRGLMDFDLASIPSSAIITSASLNLYWHTSLSNIGHSTLSGSNDCWLRRITAPWEDSTVTWNNQPATTTINQVYLPASLNDTVNYPNINVTDLIRDIKSDGYGMMFMLNNEQFYRSLKFASISSSDPTKTPWIEICYHLGTSISNDGINENPIILVYPNPASNNLTIETPSHSTIQILTIHGQLIKTFAAIDNRTNLDVSALPVGMYWLQVKTEKGVAVRKFVKE